MPASELRPTTLVELHDLADEDLGRVDIARMNLLCADKLVGSEGLDLSNALRQVDAMAAAVAEATHLNWPRFEYEPEAFANSSAHFRMLVLTTVLQRDFGVAYDVPWFDRPADHTDSRHCFIHGLLEGPHRRPGDGPWGTCLTMPVLTIAVGRRLGYPLKLVSCVSHLFVRWDDPIPDKRFNIEATSRGFNPYPDDHYRTWPNPMSEADLAGEYHLASFTPQQELAIFYSARGHYYFDWCAFHHAAKMAEEAVRLFPEEPNLHGLFSMAAVMHNHNHTSAYYDQQASLVLNKGKARTMEGWERWGAAAAMEEMKRIRAIHSAKKARRKNPRSQSNRLLAAHAAC